MIASKHNQPDTNPRNSRPSQFVAEDIETGKQTTYQIVTDPAEADLRRRRIYIKAPIVQAWFRQNKKS